MKNIDEAYQKAIKVLKNCVNAHGIKASAKPSGYPQVWARDSMITLLGASFIDDAKVLQSIKSSIKILAKNQTSLGEIPNNVDVRTLKPNFQAYADGGLWFVIGNSFYYKKTSDIDFLKHHYPAIQKTLTWYEYQDVDQVNLITTTEASDWEDTLANRGKVLCVNSLYYIALKNAAFCANNLTKKGDAIAYTKKADEVQKAINYYFWYREGGDVFSRTQFNVGTYPHTPFELSKAQKEKLKKFLRLGYLPKKTILIKENYYLPYLSFRDYGEWFDSFGNLLTILSGVADKKRSYKLLDLIEKFGIAKPYPIKAIHPPIFPNDKDWRRYLGSHNQPHHYHNGGIWPFLGGFYVATLIKMKKFKEAEKALESLALLNKKGKVTDWEFNEWFHGKTGEPMGKEQQAWSAGMYIYAYEAVRKKKIPFF